MQYGLPYKGSKSKIADQIIEQLPPGKVLYDLFAGGCAITHAAILSGKWGRVVANDIKPYPGLFKDAALGKYREEYKWVSRDDFFKSDDPFDRLIFSFGNDLRTYIYAAGDVENWKKALHYAVCFRDYKPFLDKTGIDLSAIDSCRTMRQRRIMACQIIKDSGNDSAHLENLERLDRLQNLERLERICNLESKERLRNLDRLEIKTGDYFDVEIEGGGVIYCDIPYAQTNGYGAKKMTDFDYETFYEWALKQTAPIFISEYQMPDEFECIWETKVNTKMDAFKRKESLERLFVPRGSCYQKTTLF